jgi:hypothetical protein
MSAANTPTLPSVTDRGNNLLLVTRSAVPAGRPYGEYKQFLRFDFFHSCAYCTMSEAEATAIRFTIDHYEPRTARPDLLNEYGNLMYSCDECNLRKGDRSPPAQARAAGHRFFRPDEDIYTTHFETHDLRVEGKTNVGSYSIEALDLNRYGLRRLRDIRRRLTKCEEHVSAGIMSLRRFHFDQLPNHLKGRVAQTISEAAKVAAEMGEEIDALLRQRARSELIDPDPEREQRAEDRARKLTELTILHPGAWRGRHVQQKPGVRKRRRRRKRR